MPTSHINASSGIEGLDQILGGGFPSGHLHLIQGQSGTGKTTLCLQFLMEGARKGEKSLYLGTSETVEELRAIAKAHGWSLDGVELQHLSVPLLGEEQTVLDPAEVELPQTINAMLEKIDEISPSRLVIDSLAEIRALARDELWYRRQLMTLKKHFSSHHQCTVLLTEIPEKNHSSLHTTVSGVVELARQTPLYGPEKRLLKIAKMRGRDFSSGYHDYRIRKGGVEVFPRLTAAHHRENSFSGQFSTGLKEMDEMLKGGLYTGTSTLLLGPTGTGKSVMATQLAYAAADRGEKILFFAFDERVQTLFQRSEGIGLPLKPHVDQGNIDVRQLDPAEWTCGQFSHAVKEAVESGEVTMLVIDSLNGYAHAMPENSLLGIYLHELFSYLNQKSISAVFTMTQHGLVSEEIQQPFDVSYIADTVIVFRHFELQGGIRKAFSVYKCRSGPHETYIREFQIGPKGLEVGQPLTRYRGILKGSPEELAEPLHETSSSADKSSG